MTEKKTTVEYHAESLFVSKTFWAGVGVFVIGILSLPEVLALIPMRYLPAFTSVVGVIMIALRKMTTRPAAFIMPGETIPVVVDKLPNT